MATDYTKSHIESVFNPEVIHIDYVQYYYQAATIGIGLTKAGWLGAKKIYILVRVLL